jgi:hypothetical protein
MATTVGQHACASFSVPQRGDSLDANVVRGNDNTLRSAYVDHDADPGIHVQSSDLSARPSAASAGVGAKWINSDFSAAVPRRLWYSDGTSWYEVSSTQAAVDGTAAAPGIAFANDVNTGLFTPSTGSNILAIATDGNERGRVIAGGFTKFSDDGTYRGDASLYHEARSSKATITLAVTNSNATPSVLLAGEFTAASPDNNTARFLSLADATTDRCIIYSDGDLANHDGVYGTISDVNLKQDIIDAPSQWDDLKAVQFRKYRMKSDVVADSSAPYLLGVIAQEIEQTSPGLVEEQANEDGTTTKIVKSSILLMKAAKALQEAMERIEQLEVRVAALEA